MKTNRRKGLGYFLLIVGIVLIIGNFNGLLLSYYGPFFDSWYNNEGFFRLKTDLPDGPSTMPILQVTQLNISTSEEATSYALNYFPEFPNMNLSWYSGGYFSSKVDEINFTWIEVYPTGYIFYFKEMELNMIDPSDFSEKEAFSKAEIFINAHGGKDGAVVLDWTSKLMAYDSHDNEYIHGYSIMYRYVYNGYVIAGGDHLHVRMNVNGGVSDMSKLKREILNEKGNSTIITSKEAFELMKSHKGDYHFKGEHIDIIGVELCYYSYDGYSMQDTMNPAWRFRWNEGKSDLFVDAVTGERMK